MKSLKIEAYEAWENEFLVSLKNFVLETKQTQTRIRSVYRVTKSKPLNHTAYL